VSHYLVLSKGVVRNCKVNLYQIVVGIRTRNLSSVPLFQVRDGAVGKIFRSPTIFSRWERRIEKSVKCLINWRWREGWGNEVSAHLFGLQINLHMHRCTHAFSPPLNFAWDPTVGKLFIKHLILTHVPDQ
jgi:hypothetical protein